MKVPQSEKLSVGRYASENGVAAAVRHFKERNLKESTVRDWRNLYLMELKEKVKVAGRVSEEVVVTALPVKKRGRPPIIGVKLDRILQDMIIAMRQRGTPIGTSVIIGVARGLLLKNNKSLILDFGGHISLNKEWAKSVLRRMNFTKRRGNSKAKVLPHDLEVIKKHFLIDIKSVIAMEDIPTDLVINWDQTAMKIVPSSSWTMEKRGTKRVEICAIDDKRQITAVFGATLNGDFLPVQLIYKGTTSKCLPNTVAFPKDWHITYSANHWSTSETMMQYLKQIIIPYITKKRTELKLSSDHCALYCVYTSL